MSNDENVVHLEGGTDLKNTAVFLSTSDIAAYLGCSEATARQIMNRKDFPLIRVGKNYKVFKPAFEKWAMERRD